jgi:hypothetical protein
MVVASFDQKHREKPLFFHWFSFGSVCKIETEKVGETTSGKQQIMKL